jgi:hypothetical protein
VAIMAAARSRQAATHAALLIFLLLSMVPEAGASMVCARLLSMLYIYLLPEQPAE